jgi:uncharacterized SAM-binding protein YcdF (DUF218 family)
VMGGNADKLLCCVEFGREAVDTITNAEETARFARRQNTTKLIVVTEDYHMPRALRELKTRMPEVALVPWPVKSALSAPGRWQSQPKVAAKLAWEYTKYIVVSVREVVLSIGRESPGGDDPSLTG